MEKSLLYSSSGWEKCKCWKNLSWGTVLMICFLRFHKAEILAYQLKGISFLKPFQNNSLYQRIVITPDILNDNFRLSLLGNFRENLPKNAFRTVCNLIGATYDGLIFPGIVTLQNTMPPFLDFFSPGIFQNPI